MNGNRHPGGTTVANPLDSLLQKIAAGASSARTRQWAEDLLLHGESAFSGKTPVGGITSAKGETA